LNDKIGDEKMRSTKVKIAIMQKSPIFLNLDASVAKACELISQASSEGAYIVAFPETWLPGYPVWIDTAPSAALWGNKATLKLYRILAENSLEINSVQFNKILQAASQHKICLIIGAHEKYGGTLYNSMILINGETSEWKIHRKIMPTYTERLIWGMGDGSAVDCLDSKIGPIGGLICWEHWMPLLRAYMHSFHEVIHIAQWPSVGEIHQIASRHYAFEGQCFVLAAGTILTKANVLEGFDSLNINEPDARALLEEIKGDDNRLLQRGGSAVIAPNLDYVVEPVFNQEIILYAEIDLKKIHESHMLIDTNGHYSRPDIFKLIVNKNPLSNVVIKKEN